MPGENKRAMCSRYMLTGGHARGLLAKAGVSGDGRGAAYPEDNYNIAPTSRIRAVRPRPGRPGRECAGLTWGLRLRGVTPFVVNVRAESLVSKPGFRDALMTRRCLVPASGFFEWEKSGNLRFPWLFQLRDAEPFFLAGIWNPATDGDENDTCAIITTEANGLMKPLHHRMPVIVTAEETGRWLDAGAGVPQMLPMHDDLMTARRVSTFVNNARNNGPECVAEPDAGDMPDGRQGWLF